MEIAANFAAQLNCLASRNEYLAAAGELLFSLFPSELVARSFLDVPARTGEFDTYPSRPVYGLPERAAEVSDDNYLFLSYARDSGPSIWTPRRLSDLVSDRELRQTRTYQEGLRPLGIDCVVSLLVSKPSPLSSCLWGISRWHHDFSDNEVELSAKLQPMLRLLEAAYGGRGEPMQMNRGEDYSLTAREQQIVQFLGKGLTGLAIGHLLGISPRTVAKHLEHAYAKLGVTNRIDALNRLRSDP